MKHPEVVEYIKQQRASGFKKKEITAALMESGWTKKDIRHAWPQPINYLRLGLIIIVLCFAYVLFWLKINDRLSATGIQDLWAEIAIRFDNTTKVDQAAVSADCNDPIASAIIADKKITTAESCSITDVRVDGELAKLVAIKDFLVDPGFLGRGYYDYWLWINGKIVDFTAPPALSLTVFDKIGRWCAFDPATIDSLPYVTSQAGKYFWTYHFSNFDNKKDIEELMQHLYDYRASQSPQYCTLDGTIIVEESEDLLSKLAIKFSPLPPIPKNADDLIDECENSGKHLRAGTPSCTVDVAIGEGDTKICERLPLKDQTDCVAFVNEGMQLATCDRFANAADQIKCTQAIRDKGLPVVFYGDPFDGKWWK